MTTCDPCPQPTQPNARGTKLIAGAPYHWHQIGDVLELRKGRAPADEPENPSAAYREWMSK